MNVVPVDMEVPPPYVTKNLKGNSIGSLDELRKRGKEKEAYFYLECLNGSMFLYDEHILPHQFGRQIVAQLLGMSTDAWDWRIHPYHDKASATWKKLREEVQRMKLSW